MLVSTTAWGQEFDPWSYENPEKTIKSIDKNWAKTPLKVSNDFPGAIIRDFAKAFSSKYQQYAPNVAMMMYLKDPDNFDAQNAHFYVDDVPRNGYIKCDMLGQFDYVTEICYWKRANGHSLVGVLLQMGHEGEGTINDYALMFYDYNPSTRLMTPDKTISQKVKAFIAKHRGTPSFRLPKEDKDIQVNYVRFVRNARDYDFEWQNWLLKWGNNTFKEVKVGSGVY